jgi:hypothetical protein
MSKRARNSDGTIRRANQPKQLTNRSIIARWVEAETLHLKRLGMGYQAIADHIVVVAQGHQKAMVPIPSNAQFPPEYRISMQATHLAFKRAIVRLPNAEAAELRKLDSERLDDMFLSLQSGIRQGDTRSIEVGVRVLSHKAEINGYKAPSRVEMRAPSVKVLVEQQAAGDAEGAGDLSRLTVEELREYRRLEAKALDQADATATQVVNAADAPDEAAAPVELDQADWQPRQK